MSTKTSLVKRTTAKAKQSQQNGKSPTVQFPQPKNKKKKTIQVVNNSIAARDSFLAALVSPFSPEAFGIRVPDPYPFPTVTHHLHQTNVVGADGTATVGCAMFLPNPVLSIMDISKLNGLATSITTTPMTRINASALTMGFNLFGSTTEQSIKNIYSSFRVVSWGIKISNLQPELSATGRIIVAMIPIGDTVPSLAELKSTFLTSNGFMSSIVGVPSSSLGSSSLLQLPSAQQFAVQDLLHGDLEVSGMYTNTSFWQFKTSLSGNDATNVTRSGDSAFVATVGGTIQAVGYKDSTRMAGGCAIVIFYEGLPPGTTNAFQIETVYHLEGSPQLATDSITVPIPSGAEKTIIGTTDVVDRSMGIASRLENVFTFITKGADFLNRNSEAIMKVGKIASTAAFFL